MIPKTLSEYIETYSDLWDRDALIGKEASSFNKDIFIINHLFKERKILTGKIHKGIKDPKYEIWMTSSCDRALFLAPVGTQCVILPEEVKIVIAGISTSRQAAVDFYKNFTEKNGSFPVSACNAIYKGKMLTTLKNFMSNLKDINELEDDTQEILKNIKDWNPDTLKEEDFDCKNQIHRKILATQRIKDASLGFSKRKDKCQTRCVYTKNSNELFFEDSDSQSLCYGDISLDSKFSEPFIGEINEIINKNKGRKIQLLILLGKKASCGSSQLSTLNKYFEHIWICNHPSQSQKPNWQKVVNNDTSYLASIPGMGKSILEGMKIPLDECDTKLDW